ncbi:uncharacterized protein LOC126380975 isoform X1 [Pectinophora gossypiella]|uniref:uncharacterized protein LOC126380975 isoform X1 n=2 Tax=Pectinophora gossypiella TaxID=13191 RepID=UPI00214E8E56|nr:uncharacterized protein LOC126380975 isoform X1 [Pectinophora gossypiella]
METDLSSEKRALALENSERPSTLHEKQTAPARMVAAAVKSQPPAVKDQPPAVKDQRPAADPVMTKPQPSCLLCKSAHKLFTCAQFKLLNVTDRHTFTTKHNICKICLTCHPKRPCRYFFKCSFCKQKHNTLLHEDKAPTPVTLLSNSSTQVLLPTARVKLYAQDGTEVHVKALLDSGAQVSFVTAELVQLLQLQTKTQKSGVIGIGNTVSNVNQYVPLQIHSLVRNFNIQVSCYILDRITTKLPQQKVDMSNFILPPDVVLADKDFHEPSNIHILIGADIFFQVLLQHEPVSIQSPAHSAPNASQSAPTPTLLSTQFGHVIAGNLPSLPAHPSKSNKKVVSLFCTTCDSDLNDTMSLFWKTEDVPQVFTEKVSEHEACEQMFQENVQLTNNQFEVALPLKLPLDSVNDTLGDSLYLALKRFHNLENRLHKDPVLLKLYKDFIHEYLELGHGSKIDIAQYDLNSDPVYFLPHHPVVRMDKKSTKCRAVFDASMKTNKKVSLNNLLLNGPVVQKELFDILILFRFEQYVFVTDIKHMFRAVSLNEKYRPLQNILWRDSPDNNVECIQLNTVTYGLKSSSYLATRCLIELADRYAEDFPLASSILKNQTYVDDILATNDSLDALIESKEQLCKLLDLGGFQLHKWSSNRVEALHDIPTDKQYFDSIDLEKTNLCIKTLGVNYDIKSDTLTLSAPNTGTNIPDTKREVLSFISKFFDPLGLAGPLVVSAKVIMQKLWEARLEWDSILNDDLRKLWREFYKSLSIMAPMSFNRYVCLQNATCLQLIGFADASSSAAYGCCVYLRVVDSTGNVNVSLLCSKSRVNPIKQSLTVPRLELNAALLLAKLITRVHDTLSLKKTINNVVLYSDSQIVLAWIQTNAAKLNTYVANRVKEISQLTSKYTWAYVNTHENPADCLSQGVLPHELESNQLWWTAPLFLHDSKYVAPQQEQYTADGLPEVRRSSEFSSAMVCTLSDKADINLDFLDKYSDINKMQRVLAYILRFCSNTRTKTDKIKHNFISSSELNSSLNLILRYEQQKFMKNELHSLKCNNTVKSNIKALYPFIDDRGLLREGKKVIHKCIVCWKLEKNVSQQLMGSLPHDRRNALYRSRFSLNKVHNVTYLIIIQFTFLFTM